MKTLKRAEQKNVALDLEMITPEGLRNIMKEYNCFFTMWNNEERTTEIYYTWESYDRLAYQYYADDPVQVRLYITDQIKELKVIYCEEYGFYTTVAVMNDGDYIYVKL